MEDYTPYLIRTERQLSEFRHRYATYISQQTKAYINWISSWPALEWIDFLAGVPRENVHVVIGIICSLYIDHIIDIDFNATATRVRRWWTPQESEEFWSSCHRKRLQRLQRKISK